MVQELGVNNAQQRMITNRNMASSQQARRNMPPRNNHVNDVVVNHSERRYWWTARAFALIVAISLCCNFVLILAIIQLVPLYRLEPFILTFENKQEQVYDIRSIANMEDKKESTLCSSSCQPAE